MPSRAADAAGAASRPVRRPLPVWVVTLAALLLPGSGQLLNGDPMRGIIIQFFMLFLALVSYKVTGPEISIFGRFAGGILVWVVSVLDAHAIATRRRRAFGLRRSEAGATGESTP
jgi:hypothetical protein